MLEEKQDFPAYRQVRIRVVIVNSAISFRVRILQDVLFREDEFAGSVSDAGQRNILNSARDTPFLSRG